MGQVGIFPELPIATGGKTKDIDVTAIDETGFWDCDQLALRTSGGEGQRTGSFGMFNFGFLIFDVASPAGWTTRRALWPRSRKAFVRRPRSRCQKS